MENKNIVKVLNIPVQKKQHIKIQSIHVNILTRKVQNKDFYLRKNHKTLQH